MTFLLIITLFLLLGLLMFGLVMGRMIEDEKERMGQQG